MTIVGGLDVHRQQITFDYVDNDGLVHWGQIRPATRQTLRCWLAEHYTCGTLMHLEHNVPVAIIAAGLGHADTAFTMRTYVHNQPDKLALAAESISAWTRGKKSAR